MGVFSQTLLTAQDIQDLTVTAADIANNTMTAQKQTADARTKVFTYQIENLAAGADIATRVVWQVPVGGNTDISRIEILFQDATVGVDGANTLEVAVARPGPLTIGTTGVLVANQVAGTFNVPVLANNTGLVAGTDINISVTQGATADAGFISVIIYYNQLS